MKAIALDVRGWAGNLDLAARARSALGAFAGPRDDSGAEPERERPRRQRSFLVLRAATVLIGLVVAAAVIFLFVFPTTQWRDQRGRIEDTRVQVEQAETEIATLEQRIDDLEDPRTIEYIARERFGFVRPDEAAFRLQPPPLDSATFPDSWPWDGFAYLVNGEN